MRTFLLKSLNPNEIPTSPGIYFFLGEGRKILYIGKAANLRARLKSYFNLSQKSGRVHRLLAESQRLQLRPTQSEISALLEEAKLIKHLQPKYNVLWRDDKNYFFVGITKERFPRIFITHQPYVRQPRVAHQDQKKSGAGSAKYLGPFVSGRSLKRVLRLIRQFFPYCTCRKSHARTCLSAQLGLCPGFCCKDSATSTKGDVARYRATITHITLMLSGKIKILESRLKQAIEEAANGSRFEEAIQLKHQLQSLEKIFAHKGLIETLEMPGGEQSDDSIFEMLGALLGIEILERIEMYDISMIAGSNAVGAMAVAHHGGLEKANWRLFTIQRANTTNDPAMIAEILDRRLAHAEWQFPDLVIIDGGRTQLAAARRIIEQAGLHIPAVSIVKGPKRKRDSLLFGKPLRRIPFSRLPKPVQHLLTRLRDETHRFAISFHRKKRVRAFHSS